MENWKKKAVELVCNLALTYKGNPAVTEYYPQKTRLSSEESKSLKRSSPERHGVGSARIYGLLADLEKEERANVHSIIIVKDGEVIAEASRAPYSVNTAHLSHSMTKTVMGMIIGLLYDDRLIDVRDLVSDFFPEITQSGEALSMNVEHLLTMSSGVVSFGELGTVTESEWTKAFFDAELDFAPGEDFHYNSMNSYILARIADKIIREKLGTTLPEYATRRIFAPLGIDNLHWEIGTEGVLKGGWGLYMSAESWAKLGIMMLGYGKYDGKRILSERWVNDSIRSHKRTPEATGDFNYGYHLWVGREDGDFLFNGMLGQNVWICPKNNIVVALTSGNNELFQQSPALAVIKKHLGGDIGKESARIRKDALLLKEKTESFFASRSDMTLPKAPKRLLPFLPVKHTADAAFKPLCGKYTLARNNHGILPIFVRVMQNNYQGGMESIEISVHGDHLKITTVEGGVKYSFDAGLYAHKTTALDICGESYLISAVAAIGENENGEQAYTLELAFPELPNTKRLYLSLGSDGILSIKMKETPDERMVLAFIDSLTASKKSSFFMDLLEKNLGKGFIESKLRELFAPELVAVNERSDAHDEVIMRENGRVDDKIASSALIRSLIYSFIGITPEPEAKRPTNILASILGKLFG